MWCLGGGCPDDAGAAGAGSGINIRPSAIVVCVWQQQQQQSAQQRSLGAVMGSRRRLEDCTLKQSLLIDPHSCRIGGLLPRYALFTPTYLPIASGASEAIFCKGWLILHDF